MNNPDIARYRCHTGHSFTAAALLTSQSEKIEETLWTSLRMFEERKNLLNNMAQKESHPRGKDSYALEVESGTSGAFTETQEIPEKRTFSRDSKIM